MSVNINLLPKKSRKKSSLIKVYRNLKIVNIIGTMIFFASIFIIVVVIFINGNKVKDLGVQENTLKKQVESLSSVEKKYVFLKDRAKDLKEIKKKGNAKYEEYYNLVSEQTDGVDMAGVEIKNDSIELQASILNNRKMVSFLNVLEENDLYKGVYLSGLNYGEGGGYSFSLRLDF